jgi:hypothetical protein
MSAKAKGKNMETIETVNLAELVASRPVEIVSVDTINTAKWNPPGRVSKAALGTLREQIEMAGGILIPLALGKGDVLADGHRRLAVARELGHPTVPVRRFPEFEPDWLWARLNAGTKAVGAKTWGQAVRGGLRVELLPPPDRRKVSELIRILGKRRYDDLMDNGRSTGILYWAVRLGHYCGDESDKSIRAWIMWLDKHDMQYPARQAMERECPEDVLLGARDADLPIRGIYTYG